MCTIKVLDVMKGKDFPTSGSCLYDLIIKDIDVCDKIILDLDGVSALPSMFLNVSIGKFLKEFGIEKLRSKISFARITKEQANRLSDYIKKSM